MSSKQTEEFQLSAYELAQARASSYLLLSRLLLEGVSAELRPYLSALPDLPEPVGTPDELAAQHQALFHFNLFPNETIFLGDDGLLGGPGSNRLRLLYQQNGFSPLGEPDHLGSELGYMAFLCGAEADAWEDDRGDIVIAIHNRQRAFLKEHLLRWLAPITVALRRQQDALFAAIGELLWSLLAEQAVQLQVSIPDAFLPLPPWPLDEADTSLRNIVEVLMLPSHSGWWLGQEQLGTFGRKLELPRGFGGRFQTTMALFRSATQYDAVDALIVALIAEAQQWAAAYRALNGPAAFVAPWQRQIDNLVKLLNVMRDEAAALVVGEGS